MKYKVKDLKEYYGIDFDENRFKVYYFDFEKCVMKSLTYFYKPGDAIKIVGKSVEILTQEMSDGFKQDFLDQINDIHEFPANIIACSIRPLEEYKDWKFYDIIERNFRDAKFSLECKVEYL